ncbi:hypothetical protein BTA51_17570 [Hahella sp. CCB-MM4]|uniref:glutaredoxin domain-containing protein n=1 Tax=Hahella sp. (strain CCB-MM4) TaxID=1926491 RepID=UPI000B9BF9CE|nr:glutaredoxin domain-containing protein [Hahella sp. CCB-MM4]OZG72160.1 hypothetical protein BTA51_17570 [Hahella sp. CCB-MM4]
MKKFLVLIVACAAIYQYKPEWIPFLDPGVGFASDGNAQTIMFTFNECATPCDKAINDLQERGVDFQLINVNDSEENMAIWRDLKAPNSFPLIVAGSERSYSDATGEIASVLAVNFGDKYLTSEEMELFERHFNSDGSDKVIMYGASWCPYCKKMREYFAENNIDYEEIDVEKASNKEQLIRALSISGYPVTYIGYHRVEGMNPKKISKLVGS